MIMPSATCAATRVINGPVADNTIRGRGASVFSGVYVGGINECSKYTPTNSSREPFYQHSKIPFMAVMNSRICAAALCQGMLKRRSMCGLTCEPNPSTRRPFEKALRSCA